MSFYMDRTVALRADSHVTGLAPLRPEVHRSVRWSFALGHEKARQEALGAPPRASDRGEHQPGSSVDREREPARSRYRFVLSSCPFQHPA
jgi:hypothetical protein